MLRTNVSSTTHRLIYGLVITRIGKSKKHDDQKKYYKCLPSLYVPLADGNLVRKPMRECVLDIINVTDALENALHPVECFRDDGGDGLVGHSVSSGPIPVHIRKRSLRNDKYKKEK